MTHRTKNAHPFGTALRDILDSADENNREYSFEASLAVDEIKNPRVSRDAEIFGVVIYPARFASKPDEPPNLSLVPPSVPR